MYFAFEDVFPEGHLIRHSNQASLSTLKIMFGHVPNTWIVKYCMYMYENVYALLYVYIYTLCTSVRRCLDV